MVLSVVLLMGEMRKGVNVMLCIERVSENKGILGRWSREK